MSKLFTLSIIPLLVSLLIAYLVTPFVIKFAKAIGAVDDPNINKHPKVIHTYPVPRAGGLATFIALTISSLIFLPPDKYLLSILLGGALIATIGTLDDKYNLNPYVRLLVQFLVAGIPIAAGIGVSFINLPFTGIIDFADLKTGFFFLDVTFNSTLYSSIFTLFWIVFLM